MTCRCRSGECDPECDGPALRAEIERLRAYAKHERSLGAEGPMIELVSAQQKIARLRTQRTEFDCRYTLGDVAELSGSHCPLDEPCLTCQNALLRTVLEAVLKGVQWDEKPGHINGLKTMVCRALERRKG